MAFVFSYGTLQNSQVQQQLLNRTLSASEDILTGYEKKQVEIKDPLVIKQSGERFHPILVKNSASTQEIYGSVLEVTGAELLKIDDYESENYERVMVELKSGKKVWLYQKKPSKTLFNIIS